MWQKQNKYYNKRCSYDGQVFDSKAEMLRYLELLALQKAGKIGSIQRQVPFELIPKQVDPSTKKVIERAVVYYADYIYQDYTKNELIVEDVKSEGTRTKEYVIKRKLMLYVHGIRISEV